MLHFHVISDTAMPVLRFGNAIKLQIDGVQSGSLCFERKISVLRESNSIRRDVNPVESLALRVANGVNSTRSNVKAASKPGDSSPLPPTYTALNCSDSYDVHAIALRFRSSRDRKR